MDTNFQDLPIIDWQMGAKLAGNNKILADEMLTLLVKNLPHDITAINQCYAAGNYLELRKQVHRLRGALCYCGTPRLTSVIVGIETELKNNIMDNLPSLFDQLNVEVNQLIKYYSQHDIE